jgi:hypothetical protein
MEVHPERVIREIVRMAMKTGKDKYIDSLSGDR